MNRPALRLAARGDVDEVVAGRDLDREQRSRGVDAEELAAGVGDVDMISDGIRAAGDAEDDAQKEAGAQRNDLLARFIAGAAVEVLDAAGRMNPRRRRRTGGDCG